MSNFQNNSIITIDAELRGYLLRDFLEKNGLGEEVNNNIVYGTYTTMEEMDGIGGGLFVLRFLFLEIRGDVEQAFIFALLVDLDLIVRLHRLQKRLQFLCGSQPVDVLDFSLQAAHGGIRLFLCKGQISKLFPDGAF